LKRASGQKVLSGVAGLEVMAFCAVDGGFDRRLVVVCRGVPSRQDQGGDQDGNSEGFEKGVNSRLSWVFHNPLILKGAVGAAKNRIKITLKFH
jgi:hypothetical protein